MLIQRDRRRWGEGSDEGWKERTRRRLSVSEIWSLESGGDRLRDEILGRVKSRGKGDVWMVWFQLVLSFFLGR